MRFLRFLIPAIAVLIGLLFLLRWLVGRSSPTPANLGIQNGELALCPSSPNCVSSRDTDAVHGMAPLAFTSTSAEAHDLLLALISADGAATLITDEPDYIHAEYRSPFWQFVDDVEFQIDPTTNQIHFRSASRLGYGDGGINRKRMQAIAANFEG